MLKLVLRFPDHDGPRIVWQSVAWISQVIEVDQVGSRVHVGSGPWRIEDGTALEVVGSVGEIMADLAS
jgi:hypothetical protein